MRQIWLSKLWNWIIINQSLFFIAIRLKKIKNCINFYKQIILKWVAADQVLPIEPLALMDMMLSRIIPLKRPNRNSVKIILRRFTKIPVNTSKHSNKKNLLKSKIIRMTQGRLLRMLKLTLKRDSQDQLVKLKPFIKKPLNNYWAWIKLFKNSKSKNILSTIDMNNKKSKFSEKSEMNIKKFMTKSILPQLI